ncbi:sensor histidine kinase [Parapusillimonas granuli]|nr:PhnD/SsuA/transferrin family substrate-binding protein [Parapusillimonas granuli]
MEAAEQPSAMSVIVAWVVVSMFVASLAVGSQAWAQERKPRSPPAAASSTQQGDEHTVLRLGILAYMGEEPASEEWRDLQRYLEDALPQYRHEILYGDLDTLRGAVADGRLDFVLTNPGQYVELEADHGIGRIATLEHGHLPASNIAVGAAVVALRDRRGLETLDDLRGRVLAATAEDAFGGYQTVWRELADLGMEPSRDLDALKFTGFPMQKVLDALNEGQADAGVVRACLMENQPDWQTRYKVLSGRYEPALGCMISTRLYPNWPFASLRDTPPTMARQVAIALLRMDADTHGMSWGVPADYQVVHDVFRELQIGPYAYLRGTTLSGLVRQYWQFGMLLLLGLFFWGLYTARTEYLVRTRTAALEQALRDREALEQRMRAGQEQADHLARLSVLGEISSTLAHELSQPLAGVSNYAQSLLRRLENGRLTDDAVREASTSIVTLSDSAAGILKRIKGFARKRPGMRDWLVLRHLVDETVALFQGMQVQVPGIQVVDKLAPGSKVKADALQIQQVLLNFFKNAQDAMRALPPDQQRITLVLRQEQGWVWLHVRDFGTGMEDAALAHLFEPFYTTREDGLGLGLSICKGIVEAHGGQLLGSRADREPTDADLPRGPGMIFSLSLPLHEHDAKLGHLSAG